MWGPGLSGVLVCVCLTPLWCRQYLSLHRPISRTGKLASVLRDELLPPTVLQVGGERTMWDGTEFGRGGRESRHVGWYRGAAMLHGYCSYPLFGTGDDLGHGSLSRCYPFVPPSPPTPLPPSSSLQTGSPYMPPSLTLLPCRSPRTVAPADAGIGRGRSAALLWV